MDVDSRISNNCQDMEATKTLDQERVNPDTYRPQKIIQ
jgi:hypothetical protein